MVPLALLAFAAGDWFQIRIVDQDTGRGVPLVELRTTNKISCWTDSNGIVAWNEPGLMDRPVYFTIQSPGYSFPGGGKTIDVSRGGAVELKIRRDTVAERLYRMTGQGIYRDSLLTGYPVPIREPALNGGVMGLDTVRTAIYRGRIFWLWGDTDRPNGPLGNFNTTSATSDLSDDPSRGINLVYFTRPDGFVKPMIPWTKGMTWMHSLMALRDPAGAERLVAHWELMRDLGKVERAGLAVFNDAKQEFDPLVEFPRSLRPVGVHGNTFRVRSGGRDYFYFSGLDSMPVRRVPAEWGAAQKIGAYEAFVEQNGRYAWKRVAAPAKQAVLFLDADTGAQVPIHCDAVTWNAWRKRWIAMLQRNSGEVWYAEADTPTGPWAYAARAAEHGNYTFYWPVSHPFFDREGGRVIYFEGTYTSAFSSAPVKTPRYDYNQMVYRMALDDARLFLPAPVYRLKDGRYLMRDGVEAARAWGQVAEIPFFALAPDRRRNGAVEIARTFYAVPLAAARPPESAEGQWDCKADDLPFVLTVQRDGTVRGIFLGGGVENGAYRDGTLRFEVEDEGIRYHLSGAFHGGKLAGGWKEDGGGKFACTRPPAEAWRESKALVILYESGGRYTTQSSPDAKPVARVWRNPVAKLMLDADAGPPVTDTLGAR